MKNLLKLLSILPILSMVSCSTFLAGSGKPYTHLGREGVDVSRVRSELGDPAYSRKYSPPRPIEKTPEYIRFKLRNNYSPSFIGVSDNESVSLCEVYITKGRYADSGAAQGAGMMFAMTLGLGELYFFPKELGSYILDSNKVSAVTFWYDAKGRYVADFRGDITELQTSKRQ